MLDQQQMSIGQQIANNVAQQIDGIYGSHMNELQFALQLANYDNWRGILDEMMANADVSVTNFTNEAKDHFGNMVDQSQVLEVRSAVSEVHDQSRERAHAYVERIVKIVEDIRG
jgi:hypothetical protein